MLCKLKILSGDPKLIKETNLSYVFHKRRERNLFAGILFIKLYDNNKVKCITDFYIRNLNLNALSKERRKKC